MPNTSSPLSVDVGDEYLIVVNRRTLAAREACEGGAEQVEARERVYWSYYWRESRRGSICQV